MSLLPDQDPIGLSFVDVAQTNHWITALTDRDAGECVVVDLALFEDTLSALVKPDTCIRARVDLTAADRGVAVFTDSYAGEGVVVDFTLLEGALAVLVDGDPALLTWPCRVT